MSLATSIKEFSDILNQISTANELNGTFSYLTFLQEFFLFSIKNLVGAILYILSFNWLKDFSYLPLLAPQLNPSSYFEDSYFEDPLSHIISFSRLPTLLEHGSNLGRAELGGPFGSRTAGYGTEQLISGFINSFFFSLPFSLPHLISMKRFLSQGVSAGVSSVLGTIAAHSLFLIGVLYGLRFLIIPWFSVEPLNYIMGILIVVAIVNELVQEKKVYIVPRSKQRQANLLKIGALNFLLTWCEESTVFHSFNHLTLNAHNTYLDLYPSGTATSSGVFNSFIIHTTYLVAFILGNCLFSSLFYFLFLQSTQYISQWTGLALARVARTLNKVVLFLIVAFTLSSFPYYGLDYLLGKVGGFLPEDPAYMETILSPTVIRKLDRDFSDQTSKNGNKKKIVPLDVNYFDQGVYLYLETPLEDDPKEDFIANELSKARGLEEEVAPTTSMESKNSFEELNYRGEYAWTFHGRYKKNGSREKTGFLSGIAGGQAFKKPKNHYMELKLQSDKRQAEAASRAADQIPLGRLSEWKEGVLPAAGANKSKVCYRSAIANQNFVQAPDKQGSIFANSNEALAGRRPAVVERLGDTSAPRSDEQDLGVALGAPRPPSYAHSSFGRVRLAPSGGDQNFVPGVGGLAKSCVATFDPLSEYVTELTESISPFEDDEGEKLLPIENLIKARYIFNPVYRTLLKTDIDAFLARQPRNHNLAVNQEYNLAKKRQLLEKYYNWLRYYSPFEKELERLYEIPKTKSFVDSVYHQQFKGTLQIARRLFSVTFDQGQTPAQSIPSATAGLWPARASRTGTTFRVELDPSGQTETMFQQLKETKKKRRVLSYDQTLYTESDADVVDEALLLHEQLLPDKNLYSQTRAATEFDQVKGEVTSKSGSRRVSPSTGEAFVPGSKRPIVDQSTDATVRRALAKSKILYPVERENKTKSITTFEDLESSSPRRSENFSEDKGKPVLSPFGAKQELRALVLRTSEASPLWGQPELRSGKDKQGAANNFDVELQKKEFLRGTEPLSSLQSNLMSRSPFIEESNSSPVYAGWDDTLRQFVVTNKFTLK